jgi:glycosyltransferase involved in cell wall biosynthesis
MLGEYVCFLDDDNTYKPNFLGKMLDALTNSNAGIAICALEDCRNEDVHDGYPELGRCDNSGFLVYSHIAKKIGFPRVVSGQDNIEDYRFIRSCADKYGWVHVPDRLVFFGINPRIPPPKDRINASHKEDTPRNPK